MKNIAIMALAVLIMGGVLWYATRVEEPTPKNVTTNSSQYENAEHGFSITYPKSFTYKNEGSDRVIFSRGNTVIAEARVLTIEGSSGETFENAVASELTTLCTENASTGFRCTGADRLDTFTTNEGFAGFRIYLTGSSTVMSTTTATTTDDDIDPLRKGPFFILPLQSAGTMSKILIVHAPLTVTSLDAETTLIRSMAESVVITPQAISTFDDSVKAFVNARIDDLSNEAAVIGSNFEVQSIETNNGTGIVTYGNGGASHTADFTYTVDARGTVSITAFKVRP